MLRKYELTFNIILVVFMSNSPRIVGEKKTKPIWNLTVMSLSVLDACWNRLWWMCQYASVTTCIAVMYMSINILTFPWYLILLNKGTWTTTFFREKVHIHNLESGIFKIVIRYSGNICFTTWNVHLFMII